MGSEMCIIDSSHTVHYHSKGTLLVNCMAETKQQTSIAPTLQRNEKGVILTNTLAQYVQYEEERVVKELHPTYGSAISSY